MSQVTSGQPTSSLGKCSPTARLAAGGQLEEELKSPLLLAWSFQKLAVKLLATERSGKRSEDFVRRHIRRILEYFTALLMSF